MIILATADKKIYRRWLDSLESPTEVRSADSLSNLRDQLRQYPAATIILHESLPGLEGVAEIDAVVSQFPRCQLFVLADIPEEHQGIEMIRAGVLGYANTHIRHDILREALKVISLGEIWVSKRLLQWLVNHCGPSLVTEKVLTTRKAMERLTPSEQRVIEHLLNGNSNKQIARKLQITERTVKAHLTSIFRKTGVKDRLHLALLVNHNGAL